LRAVPKPASRLDTSNVCAYFGLKVDDPLGVTGDAPGVVVVPGEVIPGVVDEPEGAIVVPLAGELKVLLALPGIVPIVPVVVPGNVPVVVAEGLRLEVPIPVVVVVVVVVRVPDPVTVPPDEDAAPEVDVLAEVVAVPALAPYRPFVEVPAFVIVFAGVSSGLP